MRAERREAPLSIVLVPTWRCNCRCDYCFERLTGREIDDRDWRPIFEWIGDLAARRRPGTLKIYWQGGEVLTMGADKVRRGLAIADEVLGGNGTAVEHHLQTNLLLYDGRWRDLIAEHFTGNISSSLDFPNMHRREAGVDPAAYTRRWIERKAAAEADGFTVSAVSLPSRATVEAGARRFYEFFRDEAEVRNVQVNLPFPGIRECAPGPLDRERLAGFLVDLYAMWVDSGRDLSLSPFRAIEESLHGDGGALPCCWGHNCAHGILAVGPDGSVAQCDCWLSTHPGFVFGRVGERSVDEILASEARRVFVDRPARMVRDEECGECRFWGVCHGGCPVRAYTFSGDIHSRDYYCSVYRRLFSAILESGARPGSRPRAGPSATPPGGVPDDGTSTQRG